MAEADDSVAADSEVAPPSFAELEAEEASGSPPQLQSHTSSRPPTRDASQMSCQMPMPSAIKQAGAGGWAEWAFEWLFKRHSIDTTRVSHVCACVSTALYQPGHA